MRRLSVLAMALAGLTALFAGCGGGGEEAGVLAVAFRLDEGSPLMSAYVGEPAEEPFWLPAGRYYIQALDQDDVVVSLGAVTVKDGEAVDLPPSLAAAGGVADAQRAEPLRAIANFLVDVELAEYAFLEIVSGGFELPPFDSGVEVDATDVEALFEMYAEIGAQEDALRLALSQIEAGATVSASASYVRSRWAPPPGPWEFFKKKADEWLFGGDSFLGWMKRATGEGQRERILAIAEQIPETDREQVFKDTPVRLTGDAWDFNSWMEEVRQGKLDHELAAIYGQVYSADPEAARSAGQRPIDVLVREGTEGLNKGVEFEAEAYKKVPGMGKALDLVGKTKEWDKYARKLAENWPSALEGTAREQYEEAIADKIKEDLKERAADLPWFTDEVIDKFADHFAKKAVAAVPQIVPTPGATVAVATAIATPAFTPVRTATTMAETPAPSAEATATPAPDTSWIEGYVQGIANQWLAAGYGGIGVAVAADDLRNCLTDAVQGGAGRDEAIGECPLWLYKPQGTPPPKTATPVATATFAPEPTETPAPEPTETPAPEPTEAPSPEPTQTPAPPGVQVTARGGFDVDPDYFTITENTMTLTFNTGGGSVSGDSRLHYEQQQGSTSLGCGMDSYDETVHYEGANSLEDPRVFSGTATVTYAYVLWYIEDEGGETTCAPKHTGNTVTLSWNALWEGGVVTGWWGSRDFRLTVGGQ